MPESDSQLATAAISDTTTQPGTGETPRSDSLLATTVVSDATSVVLPQMGTTATTTQPPLRTIPTALQPETTTTTSRRPETTTTATPATTASTTTWGTTEAPGMDRVLVKMKHAVC